MGRNLDVVQEPRLLVYVSGVSSQQKRQTDTLTTEYTLQSDEVYTYACFYTNWYVYTSLFQPCVIASSLSMHCLAPSLDSIEGELSLPMTAQIGLLMDGVTDLLTLSNTSVTIHQDPLFEDFDQVVVFGQNDRMVLTFTVRIV